MTLLDRFNAKVCVTEACWLWAASLRLGGYGQISVRLPNGRKTMARAHRVSWELHRGPIPPGLYVLHHCDVPNCVRPDHLFLGTTQDNTADRVKKNRTAFGEEAGPSKLTGGQIIAIRKLLYDGTAQREIAAQFGVTQSNISRINTGEIWGRGKQAAIATAPPAVPGR